MATIENNTKARGGLKKFLKENLYFLLVGLLVVGISTALVITALNGNDNSDSITPPVNVETFNPYLPMLNANIVKGYSDSELMWNATMKEWSAHKAIKFLAGEDLNVYSILDGTIASVETTLGDGTKIVIEHSNGYRSVYSSLDSTVQVSVGEKVVGGQVIGTAADTAGYEIFNAPHLSFELYKNGQKVDPATVLELGDK